MKTMDDGRKHERTCEGKRRFRPRRASWWDEPTSDIAPTRGIPRRPSSVSTRTSSDHKARARIRLRSRLRDRSSSTRKRTSACFSQPSLRGALRTSLRSHVWHPRVLSRTVRIFRVRSVAKARCVRWSKTKRRCVHERWRASKRSCDAAGSADVRGGRAARQAPREVRRWNGERGDAAT